MLTCSKCGKEFTLGSGGWMGRFEGPPAGILPKSPLTKLVVCPEDFAKLGPAQRRMWHEYVDPPKGGAAREKRPGHLGVEPGER